MAENEKQALLQEENKSENVVSTVKRTALATNPFSYTDQFNNILKMAQLISQSDMIPATYKGKPMNCVIALEQANRMGVSPLMVMQNLYVVKGVPSWTGQGCMMIIQGCGKFRDVDYVYSGEKGTDSRSCKVVATRISDGKRIEGTEITMQMVKSEGWISNTKWKNMPEQMLGYRAATFFARMYCPNELNGFATEGEAEDMNHKPQRIEAINVLGDTAHE